MPTVESEGSASRIKMYIDMVEDAIKQAESSFSGGDKEREILNLAKLYLNDSKYYFGIKDFVTALACVSYAEGLLDALRMLGHVKITWRRSKPAKVLVGGTFDILHPGHIYYIREAARHGLVYAVVATDKNVRRIKGKDPIIPQNQRLEVISSIRYVYKAVLGDEEDITKPIANIKPDIIVLGPDQPIDEHEIKKKVEQLGLRTEIIRLPRRLDDTMLSTSKIVRKIIERYCKY